MSAIIETDHLTFSALIWDGLDPADARAGDVAIEGDHDAVSRFLKLFPRPAPTSPQGFANGRVA